MKYCKLNNKKVIGESTAKNGEILYLLDGEKDYQKAGVLRVVDLSSVEYREVQLKLTRALTGKHFIRSASS